MNDKNKKTSTRTYYRYLVPGTLPNTWCGTVCGSKKAQDSAAARYAPARKNATETYVKGAGKRGPRLFGANIELIIMPKEVLVQS